MGAVAAARAETTATSRAGTTTTIDRAAAVTTTTTIDRAAAVTTRTTIVRGVRAVDGEIRAAAKSAAVMAPMIARGATTTTVTVRAAAAVARRGPRPAGPLRGDPSPLDP